jgi:hypothetical protein
MSGSAAIVRVQPLGVDQATALGSPTWDRSPLRDITENNIRGAARVTPLDASRTRLEVPGDILGPGPDPLTVASERGARLAGLLARDV